MRKILIVAAHPDDEILGSGGTVARLIREGAEGHTLILGEGITSRWQGELTYNGNKDRIDEELKILHNQATEANKIIGVELPIFIDDFPDNKFDSVPLLVITKAIEKTIDVVKPNMIFTHFRNDLNIDHRITYQAVITATRPMKDCTVREIYSFEIPSSTEWEYPLSFSPNVFWDITDTIGLKMKAMEQYEEELRRYLHPRSLAGIELTAKTWGMKIGIEYAEAFEAVRILR